VNARRENAIKQGIAFSSKNLVYKSKKQKKLTIKIELITEQQQGK